MTFEASPNESETSNNIHQQGQEQNEDRDEPLRPPRRRNLPANANQIGAAAAAVADNQQQQAAEQPTVEESATSANSAAAQQEEEEDETINNIDNEHLEEINFDYDNEELINNDPIFEQLFGNPNQFRGGQSNQLNQNQQSTAPNQSTTNQALANLQQQISGLMVGIGERPAIPAGDIVEAECENLDKDIDLINEAMNKLDQQNNLLQSRFRELLMAIVDER